MDMFPQPKPMTDEEYRASLEAHRANCAARSAAWLRVARLTECAQEAKRRASRVVDRVLPNGRPTERGALWDNVRRRIYNRLTKEEG